MVRKLNTVDYSNFYNCYKDIKRLLSHSYSPVSTSVSAARRLISTWVRLWVSPRSRTTPLWVPGTVIGVLLVVAVVVVPSTAVVTSLLLMAPASLTVAVAMSAIAIPLATPQVVISIPPLVVMPVIAFRPSSVRRLGLAVSVLAVPSWITIVLPLLSWPAIATSSCFVLSDIVTIRMSGRGAVDISALAIISCGICWLLSLRPTVFILFLRLPERIHQVKLLWKDQRRAMPQKITPSPGRIRAPT